MDESWVSETIVSVISTVHIVYRIRATKRSRAALTLNNVSITSNRCFGMSVVECRVFKLQTSASRRKMASMLPDVLLR